MASLTGFHHMSLTVTDLPRSVAWYCDVLGFEVGAEIDGGTFTRTRLRHPDSSLILTLTRHERGSTDAFSETRPGLDHVAFLASRADDVEAWKRRFEEHGVEHSELKRRAGGVVMITVRDPDNIQLEVMALDQPGKPA